VAQEQIRANPSPDQRIAQLEKQLTELQARLSTPDGAPVSVRSVETDLVREQQAAHAAFVAKYSRSTQAITQEQASKSIGPKEFVCQLVTPIDKLFPLTIRANSAEEAGARYCVAMGIVTPSMPITVSEVTAATAKV
jgi:hypothetical protein